MKKFQKNRKICIVFLLIIISCFKTEAQTYSCSYESMNYQIDCSQSTLKSAYFQNLISDFKSIRVNIHFILKDDGTGNFTETANVYGESSSEDGYWFAESLIDYCNSNLLANQTMTQQLSYATIPVNDINYGYKLVGVFFHRNSSCFYNPGSYISSFFENYDEVINVFIYSSYQGLGVSSGQECWIGGAENAFSLYLQYGGWGINQLSPLVNHEIGHCLSLDHCKRWPGGSCCTNNNSLCLDHCDDTPTYQQLLDDGYTDPCIWNGTGYSNNIMDYSPLEVAFTPCQIAQVHSYIETMLPNYKEDSFINSSVSINSFSDNKTYIAELVVVPSGANVYISNNKRLYIYAKELEINGDFEIPLGSTFEFTPD